MASLTYINRVASLIDIYCVAISVSTKKSLDSHLWNGEMGIRNVYMQNYQIKLAYDPPRDHEQQVTMII